MFGRSVFVGLGAPAALALFLIGTGTATAGPVTVESLDWQFYQGGSVSENPGEFEEFQQTFSNMASNHVTGTMGGSRFDSFASILHSSVNGIESFDFGSYAALSTEAAVSHSSVEGTAGAFSTLSMYSVSFLVAPSPVYYFGGQSLDAKDGGVVQSGDLLQPGTYSYIYFNTFGLDAQVDAGPGESLVNQGAREFRFEFTTVPGPGGAALIGPALLALGRRRRR